MIKNNSKKLMAYWFFHNFILAYVIERLFWQERGITVLQVVYLEIIYAFIIIILEIPTGTIADRWSRKGMMILGAISTCLEFGILIFAHGFWQFSLAIIIAAFGKAVTSGTSNALLYDSMKQVGNAIQFESALGKIRFWDGLSGAIAALLGSLTAEHFGLVSNYYISFGSTIIALFISFTFIEPTIKTNEKEEQHHIKTAFKFLKNNTSVVIMIVNAFMVASLVIYIDEFWQLYLNDFNFPIILFGVISLGMSLFGSIGGLFSMKVNKHLGYKKSMRLGLILFTMSLIGLGIIHHPIGILFLLIIYIPNGFIAPLVYGYLHHRVDSAFRATTESIESLGERVFSTIIGLIFGVVASRYAIINGYLFLAIFMIIYLILYLLFLQKKVVE